jgi:hypothetical protein
LTAGGVTVEDVIDAVRQRRALMAPETAGYLVLAAADQLARAPAVIDARKSAVAVDGGRVTVGRDSGSASPLDAERALRTLLYRLLQATSGGAPALAAVASAAPKGDVRALVVDLESALIPVNRAAAARALSRLARETQRAREGMRRAAPAPGLSTRAPAGETSNTPEPNDTEPIPVRARGDRLRAEPEPIGHARPTTEVDQLLELPASVAPAAPVPPLPDLEVPGELHGRWARRAAVASAAPEQTARGVDELLEGFMATDPKHEARLADDLRGIARMGELELATTGRAPTPFESLGVHDVGHHTPAPSADVPWRAEDRDRPPGRDGAVSGPRWGRIVALSLVLLVALASAALWLLPAGLLADRSREIADAERRLARVTQDGVAARRAGACQATLVVSDVPAGAEVLIGAGASPVDMPRVPAGSRLEFVATAEGYLPRRATVPAGASWDVAGGKPRFELAIQLERSRARPATIDPWPPAEPGSKVGGDGQGASGVVHVVTSPKGAEVWMVAGGAPEARIEGLPCGAGMELLVAGALAGQPFRRRLHVDSGQTTPAGAATSVVGRVSAGSQ